MGVVVSFTQRVGVRYRPSPLTDEDYARMLLLAPHDVDISIEVWAAFLSRLLDRPIGVFAAQDIITEYNTRLRLSVNLQTPLSS